MEAPNAAAAGVAPPARRHRALRFRGSEVPRFRGSEVPRFRASGFREDLAGRCQALAKAASTLRFADPFGVRRQRPPASAAGRSPEQRGAGDAALDPRQPWADAVSTVRMLSWGGEKGQAKKWPARPKDSGPLR